jgi:hypothetical protein
VVAFGPFVAVDFADMAAHGGHETSGAAADFVCTAASRVRLCDVLVSGEGHEVVASFSHCGPNPRASGG